MALDLNNARAEVVKYLPGVGPMPPPTPQDLALVGLRGTLDGGVFEHSWNADLQAFRPHPWQIRAVGQGATVHRGNKPALALFGWVTRGAMLCEISGKRLRFSNQLEE